MDIQLLQQHLLKRLFPSTELLVHLCQRSMGHLSECIPDLVPFGFLVSFKNNCFIYFLILFTMEIFLCKQKQRTVSWTPNTYPASTVITPLFSPYLFEESSAVFLYNISHSEFVSHSVIAIVLLPPVFPIKWQSGPRSLINSDYAFSLLHH